MQITIVGAGLAGTLLAQSLQQAEIDVTVYERDAAARSGQGYRLHIAPEGDLALRACLPPELYDRVLATGGKRGSGWRVLDPKLNLVQETLVPESPVEETTGRHLTVDRFTLREILLTGVDVRYGAAFDRFELVGDGVRVHLADGGAADADLLVAADGTYSRVRAQLLPDAEVTETGQAEIFGRTPLTAEARALAPAAALDGFCAITGADGRFMPLAAHQFRSGGNDYLMWVVAAPAVMFPPDLSALDKPELWRVAEKTIADWHPNLAAIIRLADPGSVHMTTMRTAKPMPPWPAVPVTLMGDAIHTMIPQGTSAAVALRDAATLSRHIAGRSGSLLGAVKAYETEMLEYGFAEVARSLRAFS